MTYPEAVLVSKLPGHTPPGLLPCRGGRSGERPWRGDWQTPPPCPSGSHRKPRCCVPGEKKKSPLNGDYSSGRGAEEVLFVREAWEREPCSGKEPAFVQELPPGSWQKTQG